MKRAGASPARPLAFTLPFLVAAACGAAGSSAADTTGASGAQATTRVHSEARQSGTANSPGGDYAENVGISTPNEHITGITSGPARGAMSQENQKLLDKVVDALVADNRLEGASIKVNVDKGSIILNGTASTRGQAQHARQVARNAAGNAPVRSNLAPQG